MKVCRVVVYMAVVSISLCRYGDSCWSSVNVGVLGSGSLVI